MILDLFHNFLLKCSLKTEGYENIIFFLDIDDFSNHPIFM